MTGSWGRRPVAHQHHNAALPCGGRRKSCHTLPVLRCAALFLPFWYWLCAVFTRTAYLCGGVSRLPQNTTQPYPEGALHKAATAAVFTSSLPNAVWQLHISCAAPKRLSYHSGHTLHDLSTLTILSTPAGHFGKKEGLLQTSSFATTPVFICGKITFSCDAAVWAASSACAWRSSYAVFSSSYPFFHLLSY